MAGEIQWSERLKVQKISRNLSLSLSNVASKLERDRERERTRNN